MSSYLCRRLQGLFSKHTSAAASCHFAFVPSRNLYYLKKRSTIPKSATPKIDIEAVVKRFQKYSRSKLLSRPKDNLDIVFRRLALGNHYYAIQNILVGWITLYGKTGMFGHAYKLFDDFPQLNCPHTVTSFNALLSACLQSKNYAQVHQLFRDLPHKLGIQPDLVSYNTVIKAFCEDNDFDSAIKFVEEMEGGSIRPDIVGYNTILEGYYRENKVAEAENLLKRMEEMNVLANVRTYNAMLRNLMGKDKVQEALDLVEKMVKKGVSPDNYTYNALIKGFVSDRKFEEAKTLHQKMVMCCFPHATTYQKLIALACDQGDINFAVELSNQAAELKVAIRRSLMQLVVNASKGEEARQLVPPRKRQRGSVPFSFTTLLN